MRVILGFEAISGGCGTGTIHVTPRGEVLPCVYRPRRNLGLADLEKWGPAIVDSPALHELALIAQFCRDCRFVESCRGECPSRRLRREGLDLSDKFCPFVAQKPLPSFAICAGSLRQFPKAGSACPTVLGAHEE
jgi:radical SAM protein with 4Fe4S-binding SPASM domain